MTPIEAMHHVRPLHGRTKPHLMCCEGDQVFLVKMAWNPLGEKALVSDYLGSTLARWVGLPVPECHVIKVDKYLVEGTQQLLDEWCWRYDTETSLTLDWPELHFGSRFLGGSSGGAVWNALPEKELDSAVGLEALAGALAMDIWCSAASHREAIFCRSARASPYRMFFIDYASCFRGDLSRTPVSDRKYLMLKCKPYDRITGWDSFEPYLTQIVTIPPDVLWAFCAEVPSQWHQTHPRLMDAITDGLLKRRTQLRACIAAFRDTVPSPFPNWQVKHRCFCPSRVGVIGIGVPDQQLHSR